jgi:hypothetical protein
MFNPDAYYEEDNGHSDPPYTHTPDNFGLTPKDYNNPLPENAETPSVQHQNGFSKKLDEATKLYYRAEYVFCELMNCECCDRHKKDKPTLHHFDHKSWKDCEHWNNSQVGDIDKECYCPCRHYMRLLATPNLNLGVICIIIQECEEFIPPPESPPKVKRAWAIQR